MASPPVHITGLAAASALGDTPAAHLAAADSSLAAARATSPWHDFIDAASTTSLPPAL